MSTAAGILFRGGKGDDLGVAAGVVEGLVGQRDR